MAPLAESERRLEALRGLAGGAARSLRELGHLLASEQEAIDRELDVEREAFVREARGAVSPDLRAAVAASPAPRRSLHAEAAELARRTALGQLESWRAREQAGIEAAYRRAAQRFVDLANGFLDRLTDVGTLAASLPRLLGSGEGLRGRSHHFYREAMDWTGQGPWRWLSAPLLPRARLVAREQRFALRYVRHLLDANAARVMNDLKDRVLESRRQLEAEVRVRLAEAVSSADRAVEAARLAHARGQDAVASSLAELDALQSRLDGALTAPVAQWSLDKEPRHDSHHRSARS